MAIFKLIFIASMRAFPTMLLLLFFVIGCNKEQPLEQKPFPYQDMPLIRIQTNGVSINNESKIESGIQVLQHGNTVLDGKAGIEFRGSTSYRLFEKKSYGLEMLDAAGQVSGISILGMPKEEDWVLYGPYSEKSLLHNYLVYDWSNKMGRYASRTRWVELELNGQYEGVYILMEKIKRNGNRVDISKMDAGDITPGLITGGYMLKIDKAVGESGLDSWEGDATYLEPFSFRSNYGIHGELLNYPAYGPKQPAETYFIYSYPDPASITPEQKAYIQGYMVDFEASLSAEDFSGNTRAYSDFIDVGSFVDNFLLNEISANPDAYRLSTFLYKDRNGKLNAGPVWDFNLGFGNDGRSSSSGWIYQYNTNYPDDLWLVPFWWEKLMQDPQFRTAVKTRWFQLRNTIFEEDVLLSQIDEQVAFLKAQGAVERNFNRWKIIGVGVAFNSFVGATYDEEVDYLKSWISARISWMDGQIRNF
jgi:hypothetical protein